MGNRPRHSEFLLPSGEKVRMRGSFCATLTLSLSLKGEGKSLLHPLDGPLAAFDGERLWQNRIK